MKTNKLLLYIIDLDFENFKLELVNLNLTQVELQHLSIEILSNFEFENNFKFLKQIFDSLFDKKLIPNFIIDDQFGYKTSLLLKIIEKHSNNQILSYFVDKGCIINMQIIEEDSIFTPLDYINDCIQYLTYDSEFSKYLIKSNYITAKDNLILVDKTDYENLIETSLILNKIYKTSILRDTIIAFGGKTYK